MLGPLPQLCAADREGLRRAVERWDVAATPAYRIRGLESVLHILWRFRLWCLRCSGEGWPLAQRLFEAVDVLTFAVRRAPEALGKAVHRVVEGLRAKFGGEPSVEALLTSSGMPPHVLCVRYVRPLRQSASHQAFWTDEEIGRTVGCVLGLDLVPGRHGVHVIESNLNAAQRIERARLYRRDPFVDNLVSHAAERDYRHLVVVDNRLEGVNPLTAEQYEARAREEGVGLTIVDHAHVPDSPHRRSFGLPDDLPEGALVVRLRSYPVSTDYLLTDKLAVHRALSLYREQADEPELRLPSADVTPVLGDHGPEAPFPNVVSKRTDSGQGRDVHFAKARSPGHAADLFARTGASSAGSWPERLREAVETRRLVFEEYVRPELLDGRRPYIVRAHVLVSPEAVVFLSAHRVVSHRPVPERLPTGIVDDPTPFIVNFSADSDYERVPESESAEVRRAALAAGRGFAWALRESFRVSSSTDPSGFQAAGPGRADPGRAEL